MRLVVGLTQDRIRCFENGERSEAQISKAGWQQQPDAQNGELLSGGAASAGPAFACGDRIAA